MGAFQYAPCFRFLSIALATSSSLVAGRLESLLLFAVGRTAWIVWSGLGATFWKPIWREILGVVVLTISGLCCMERNCISHNGSLGTLFLLYLKGKTVAVNRRDWRVMSWNPQKKTTEINTMPSSTYPHPISAFVN